MTLLTPEVSLATRTRPMVMRARKETIIPGSRTFLHLLIFGRAGSSRSPSAEEVDAAPTDILGVERPLSQLTIFIIPKLE
jgi:hypothetical protein